MAVIPRRVHRIWLGPYRMPAGYVAHAVQWERFGWPVHDWSQAELERLPLSDATLAVVEDITAKGSNAGGGLPQVARWVQLADVYAYEILRHVGGVYANTDIEPLKDLGEAIDGLDAFVVGENEHFLSNALMGAAPGHPFLVDVCATLPARFWEYRWEPMNQATGPHHLTERWAKAGHDVARLSPVPFFPVDFAEEHAPGRRTDGFWVDHHWGHQHPELLQ